MAVNLLLTSEYTIQYLSLHITYKHTASSFLVLFITSFAFDAFVWFTTAFLTVLRHAYCKTRPHHIINMNSTNIFIIHKSHITGELYNSKYSLTIYYIYLPMQIWYSYVLSDTNFKSEMMPVEIYQSNFHQVLNRECFGIDPSLHRKHMESIRTLRETRQKIFTVAMLSLAFCHILSIE